MTCRRLLLLAVSALLGPLAAGAAAAQGCEGTITAEEAVKAELLRHRALHEQTLATYRGLMQSFDMVPAGRRERYFFPLQTLRLGVLFEEAWLQWCDEVMADIAARTG